ncbi:HSPB1-associated protein 1 homolog isoform X1 [Hypanus sabinus]|uniref:HSPB1-associated protein 1 homolog isoform X1 n=2 Tax=Hypanus sabinus TaxID=79690 RepID=UPI0028C411B4|nr:HSPB1-associated protein 1 homolog isoform X1 [Hypanus sabinus]
MSEDSKPFNAEEVRTVIESLQKPVVFLNMVSDWPAMRWTIENLSQLLNGKELTFRIGKRKMSKAPQFETQCQYIQATLQEFLVWLHGDTNSSPGLFLSYPRSEYWAYADYKYVAKMFEDKAELFQDIIWSDFGFPGRDGRDSTLWIGSEAANTPCHLDSYGCNLVLQVQGRKRWHLFPPEDTCFLYPTRIPYEESSVFSSVNVVNPDLKHFPRFRRARPYVVNLCPGEVLFVPRHWWHYVESLDPVTISINSWIELGDDNEARVGEALARTVVCAVKSADPHTDPASWLNTTEGAVTSYETNLHYVNLAVQSCLDNDKMHPASCTKGRDQSVQLSSGLPKKRKANSEPAEFAAKNGRGKLAETKAGLSTNICIGPNLVPVKQVAAALEEDSVSSTSGDLSLASRLEAKQCSLDCDSKPADNVRRLISTDDLLNCLVHPDVIQLMTEILLGRHYSH